MSESIVYGSPFGGRNTVLSKIIGKVKCILYNKVLRMLRSNWKKKVMTKCLAETIYFNKSFQKPFLKCC